MAMNWVRWYHGTATDPKWRLVARKSGQRLTDVIAVWAMVLEAASEASERGTLEGFDPEVAAAALDLDPEAVVAILDAMQGRVLDGNRLSGWDKRNPKREDDSAERVRRYRERKRRERQAETQPKKDVTQCNADETRGNASDKDVDGDIERDTSIHPQTSTRAGEVIPLRVISGAGPPDDREELVSRIIRAANAGMAANPAIDQARFRPIPTTHGSRQYVLDWLAEGIDADVILEAVSERARQYQPDGRHRQISTMAYFDAAIRDEVERRRATEEGGNYDHHRGRSTPKGRGASSSARPVALGAGDPARRSGWVYE